MTEALIGYVDKFGNLHNVGDMHRADTVAAAFKISREYTDAGFTTSLDKLDDGYLITATGRVDE